MSSFAQHPENGLLLRYLDGELPGRKARQVRKHLEACWQCRAEVEELQATVADCVRYRKNVLEALLPEPPRAWRDLSRGFAEIDAQDAAQPAFPSFAPWLKWGLAAAAAMALTIAVVYQLRFTPSVRAATLLHRAVAAADQKAGAPREIRVRTKSQVFLRTVDRRHGEPALPVALAARFEAAHYDASDPLSPRPFEKWRAGLSGKRDEVSTVADPQRPAENCYRIETVADGGEIASATIMLRTRDFSPVESMFQFRDRDWVEFNEIAETPGRSNDSPVATNPETPLRPAVPSRLAVDAPRPAASVTDELQVLSALHQIGADLGDPVVVTTSGDRVVVSGEGIPAARQRQIQSALEGLPRVTVQFADPAAQAALGEPQDAAPATPAAPSRAAQPDTKVQIRLEEQLGGRAELERFSSRILDLNESAMSRAYALHNLAEKFPAGSEAGMTAADRATLRAMAREHASALASQVNTMQRALGPVLQDLGATAAGRHGAAETAGWQSSADEVLRASRRVEVLVSDLLGVSAAPTPAGSLPADLMVALADLQASVEQCQSQVAR
jgi:anti-sigma factor RsiW